MVGNFFELEVHFFFNQGLIGLICTKFGKLLGVVFFLYFNDNWRLLELYKALFEFTLLPFKFVELLFISLNIAVYLGLKHIEITFLLSHAIGDVLVFGDFLGPINNRIREFFGLNFLSLKLPCCFFLLAGNFPKLAFKCVLLFDHLIQGLLHF